MSSCDYYGDYYYYIENGLETEIVTVKTNIQGYRYPNEILDSVFVLLPNERKLIRNTPTGNSAKHEHPDDILEHYCELGEFKVFIDNQLLDKQLWERKYWQYSTKELKGTYLLVIDENLIHEDK
jgi:hypothetical protein